jgi:hypothetical protein
VSDHPGGRRPPVLPGWAVAGAAALYAALLVVITLLPIRWRSDLARHRSNWRPQLVPLWNMVVNLRDGDRALATLAGAAGNVALFLPLGFLLPLLAPGSTAGGGPSAPGSRCRRRSSCPRSRSPGSAGPTSTTC